MHRHRMSTSGGLLLLLLIAGGMRSAASQPVPLTDTTPGVSLFDSVERIRLFLEEEAVEDYTGTYLYGVALHYFEGTPRQGPAWVYTFSYDPPRLGGEPCIAHFMDGEIVELRLGP